MHRLRPAAVFLLAVGLIVGCGGDQFGEVSGTATYDGTPIEQGAISFIPSDGKGPSSGGNIKDGKYRVEKVPVGNAKVRISGAKITGTKKMYNDPNSPVVQSGTELVPAKYNQSSELTYEVKSGSQTKDFDLPK